jgi:hypothetical protein
MAYFQGVTTSLDREGEASVAALNKALTAGYGTDSAMYVNGRAMIPENLESTMLMVMSEDKNDCKVLNSLKKVAVSSTVHEKNRRVGVGEFRFLSTPELGGSAELAQEIERVIFEQKYLQTRCGVSRQMELAREFEDAYTVEKVGGVERISKAIEYNIFHGDSSVIPTEFDGFLAAIRKSKRSNVVDQIN